MGYTQSLSLVFIMRSFSLVLSLVLSGGVVEPFAVIQSQSLITKTRSSISTATFSGAFPTIKKNDTVDKPKSKVSKPDLFGPFLPDADPTWMCRGPAAEGDFIVSHEGKPMVEELSSENI
jgi:hypothetical protein